MHAARQPTTGGRGRHQRTKVEWGRAARARAGRNCGAGGGEVRGDGPGCTATHSTQHTAVQPTKNVQGGRGETPGRWAAGEDWRAERLGLTAPGWRGVSGGRLPPLRAAHARPTTPPHAGRKSPPLLFRLRLTAAVEGRAGPRGDSCWGRRLSAHVFWAGLGAGAAACCRAAAATAAAQPPTTAARPQQAAHTPPPAYWPLRDARVKGMFLAAGWWAAGGARGRLALPGCAAACMPPPGSLPAHLLPPNAQVSAGCLPPLEARRGCFRAGALRGRAGLSAACRRCQQGHATRCPTRATALGRRFHAPGQPRGGHRHHSEAAASTLGTRGGSAGGTARASCHCRVGGESALPAAGTHANPRPKQPSKHLPRRRRRLGERDGAARWSGEQKERRAGAVSGARRRRAASGAQLGLRGGGR